ncbi:MAG TPA: type 1 glutamine amidotransferase domain-containing protein [Magnetospirillaceae bacterium]|jgi:protease I
MNNRLDQKRIAIVATDGFEQSELFEPRKALLEAGAVVEVVAPKGGSIQGVVHGKKGKMIAVDCEIDAANADDYAALVLPGGVANPDSLRMDGRVVDFVRHFVEAHKPIAAICHGPWTLIEAKGVRGRKTTSWPSLKTDLENAGAQWVDQEVVVEDKLITSRKPEDLPAFCRVIVDEFEAA